MLYLLPSISHLRLKILASSLILLFLLHPTPTCMRYRNQLLFFNISLLIPWSVQCSPFHIARLLCWLLNQSSLLVPLSLQTILNKAARTIVALKKKWPARPYTTLMALYILILFFSTFFNILLFPLATQLTCFFNMLFQHVMHSPNVIFALAVPFTLSMRPTLTIKNCNPIACLPLTLA